MVVSKTFNKEFNYSFPLPYNDTYDTCDSYIRKFKGPRVAENKLVLQNEYEDHLKKQQIGMVIKQKTNQLPL